MRDQLVRLSPEQLAAVIGRRVKLIRSGDGWLGLCPNHNDHNSSLHVFADRREGVGRFHCFVCGRDFAGTSIDWLMRIEGKTWKETQAVTEWPRFEQRVVLPNREQAEADKRRKFVLECWHDYAPDCPVPDDFIETTSTFTSPVPNKE